MIDSYITYEPNPAGENSPDFFSKHLNEIFSYNLMETEDYSLLPSSGLPPINEIPNENLMDQFGNDSAYSTNPSTKHSPEYTPNEEDQEDQEDNEKFIPSKVPPITKKGIKKQYEPILDNGIVYRYEEDPNEYRKARKRIQNRESATRVRNRKRTRAEELADEVKILNKEKAELKVQNATLAAENNMLKQQVGLLERMISRVNQEEMSENADSLHDASRTEISESIINLITKNDDDIESRPKYVRAAPAHSFKKHVAMLGVFTLLLCVYGLLPRTENRTTNLLTSTKSLFSRPNTLYFSKPPGSSNLHINPQDLLENQRNGDPGENWLAWVVEMGVMICYLAYFIYVGVSFYKYRAQRKKAYAYSPL